MESKEQAKSKLIDTIGHYNLTANNVSKFSFNKRETELFTNMMVEFVKEQTTSQQHTIERLIKGIEWEIAILRDERAKNGWRLSEGKQHSRLVKLLESAQLLNTTETSKAKGE